MAASTEGTITVGHASQAAVVAMSFFARIRDTHPVRRDLSAGRLLERLAEKVWYPAVAGSAQERKQTTAVGSGAVYADGGTRCRDGVLWIQAAMVDLDNSIVVCTGKNHRESDGRASDRPETTKALAPHPIGFEEAVHLLDLAGIASVAYTTLSHTDAHPRIRLIIPFREPVTPEIWPMATDWILARIGIHDRLQCVDLPCLRNPTGVGVLPTPPVHAELLRERVDGNLLVIPQDEVRQRQLYTLPVPEWQRELQCKRLMVASLVRPHPIWRVTDPADILAELGCLVFPERPWRHGTKRRTTCPWAIEHSGGLDDDCGVVFYPTSGRPSWRCAHAGHAHMGVMDLLRATGRA